MADQRRRRSARDPGMTEPVDWFSQITSMESMPWSADLPASEFFAPTFHGLRLR
jgi:hypothetical protein